MAVAVTRFDYHRGLTPMIGVILSLALIETLALYIIAMALWGWKVAAVLALIDGSMVMALIMLLHSFRTRPITIEGDTLTLRTGRRLSVTIPIATIAGFRDHWTAGDLKPPSGWNMALAAWPNVAIELRRPIIRRRRAITLIAHRLDDPSAFRAAIEPMLIR